MPRTKHSGSDAGALGPLPEVIQLGARVYQALVNGIIAGQLEPGAALRPDVIARQLEVSTTPVREAMHRLEGDGLVIKMPYQGWFVREFTPQQIRDLYELRAALECFAVRLACVRVTEEEIAELREQQAAGRKALEASDLEAYRDYNRDLHEIILRAAKNSYLSSMMGQLRLQTEMLMAATIRMTGRPVRALDEHERLVQLIAARDSYAADRLMSRHILGALEDIQKPPERP